MKKMMKGIEAGIGTAVSLSVGLVASAILIALGLVYFVIALAIVKFGSGLLGYALDGNWAVLSATLLSVASIIGSAIKK